MTSYHTPTIERMSDERYLRNELRRFQQDHQQRKYPCTYKGMLVSRSIPGAGELGRGECPVITLTTFKYGLFEMLVNGELVYQGRLRDFKASTAYTLLD